MKFFQLSCNDMKLKIIFPIFLFLLLLPETIQAQNEGQDGLSAVEIQALQNQVLENINLTDEMRDTVISVYSKALEAMEKTREYRVLKDNYERELLQTDKIRADFLAELAIPVISPEVKFHESMTVDQAEDVLARERARYSANLAELHDQQLIADNMTESRSTISQRLGELDLRIDLLNSEFRAQVSSVEIDEIKNAVKQRIIAQRTSANSELEMLRSRLNLLTSKSRYAPLSIDLAQRRVDYSQEIVDIYKRQAVILQAEKAHESLEYVSELSTKLSMEFPQLSELTAETELLAQNLWGDNSLISLSEKAIQDLSELRNHQNQLRRITELTLKKFKTYGNRGNINRWWPDMPEGFPEHGEISRTIDTLEKLIPEIDHQLIILTQKRGRVYELNRQTLMLLDDEYPGGMTSESEQDIRNYLTVRQDLLDELIQRGGIYANQLVEYQELIKNFLIQVKDVEYFLYSHVLWSRSVPKPVIPRFRDIMAAANWLFSLERWKEISVSDKDFKPGIFIVILILFLIIAFWKSLYRRLVHMTGIISDTEKDKFSFTIRSLVLTLLLALPVPLGLAILGKITGILGNSIFWYAASDAFKIMALVSTLLELTRLIFINKGLAEVYFHWPYRVTRALSRGLLLAESISLPFLYMALLFAFAGGRLDSQPLYQIFNNSLGRIAFIIALLTLGLIVLAIIRPEKSEKLASDYTRVSWPRRFSAYAFPTAFLSAYPLIFAATVIPSILSMMGYYLTGLLLAYQMLRTLMLLLVVLLVSGIAQRARQLGANDAGDKKIPDDVSTSYKQTQGMYKFLMVSAITIGVVLIWSDAVPMLQFLKRVQVLPRIQMIEEAADFTVDLDSVPETKPESQSPSPEANPESVVDTLSPGSTDKVQTDKSAEKPALTLWMIIEALMAAGIAIALTRGLPGIIDLVLKRRSSLDHGARFAIVTLLKYSLAIIGTIVVFNLLGLKWSQIQWLAAALTFGLGFGLQEIVANFVSGLILLIERPIRVDDVVTIGELMGKVSRIQIRATTITLWDRSEMVVPNKEFITKKLVNWTLSDSKRRIDIPLRVAYGTDLEQVKKILVDCAVQNSLVLEDPQPHAIIIDFAKDAINFELRFVVDFGNGIQVRDEVQMAINHVFKEKGVYFAMPQINIQMTQE